MPRFITPRRAFYTLVLILGVAALLPPRAVVAVSDPPRQAMALLLAPLSAPMRKLAHKVRTPPDDPRAAPDYKQVLEDRELLWQYTRQLEEDLRIAQRSLEQLSQLHRYRQSLGLSGIEMRAAGVVLAPRAGADATLTIDAGRRDGIQPDMIVVAGYQLVGQIAAVGEMTSTVRLITAPGTHLGVRVVPASPGPVAREFLGAAESDPPAPALIVESPRGAPVQVGDLAHVFNDPRYHDARGFVVGRVSEIRDHRRDPTLRAQLILRPDTSLAHLDRVVVLMPVKPAANAPTAAPPTRR